MSKLISKSLLIDLFKTFFAVFSIASFFLRPSVSINGILNGVGLCYTSIIPSLFPFFILSKLLLQSLFSYFLGIPLLPYTKYVLKIKEKRASTALLLGLTCGFATGAVSLQSLYNENAITKQDANKLLFCIVNAGPAFVVSCVGATMLKNIYGGVLLYIALCIGSLISGVFSVMFVKQSKILISDTIINTPQNTYTSFVEIVREAVFSTLSLCGFVVFFSFLVEILLPPTTSSIIAFLLSFPLEVTTACANAIKINSNFKIYALCIALSFMGVSIFMQVRALISKQISLFYLFISRLIHCPVALIALYFLLKFFPVALTVSTVPNVYRLSMPIDALVCTFLLCCTFFTLQLKQNANKTH